jgi:hypothetical protein
MSSNPERGGHDPLGVECQFCFFANGSVGSNADLNPKVLSLNPEYCKGFYLPHLEYEGSIGL